MVFEEEEEFDFNNRLLYLFHGYYFSIYRFNSDYNTTKLEFNEYDIRKVAFYYDLYFPGELFKSGIDISKIVDDDDQIKNALIKFFNPWFWNTNRLHKFYYCFNNVLTYSVYDKLYNGTYSDFKTIPASSIFKILNYLFVFFPASLSNSLYKLYKYLGLITYLPSTVKIFGDWKNSPNKKNLISYENFVDFIPYIGIFQSNNLSKVQRERIFTYFQKYKSNIKEIYEIFNLKHKSQTSVFSQKIFYFLMNKRCQNYNIYMTSNLENLEFILDIFNYFNSGNNIDVSNIINFSEKRKIIADKLCNENDKLKTALSYFNDIIAGDYDKIDSLTDQNLNILDLTHFLILYDALFPGNNISFDVSNENINRNRIFFLQEGRLLEFKNKINDIKKIKNNNTLFRKLCNDFNIIVKEPPKKDDKQKGKDGKRPPLPQAQAHNPNKKDGKGKDGKGKGPLAHKSNKKKGEGIIHLLGGHANDSELDISIIKYIINSCLLLFKNKINDYNVYLKINDNDNDTNPLNIRLIFEDFCNKNLELIIKLYNICSNQKITLYSDKIFTKKVYDSFAIYSCPYGKKWWKIESKYYENLRKITKVFILFMKYNNINDKNIIINWETDSIEKIYFFLCYNKIHLFDFLDYIIKHKVYYKKNSFTYDLIGTGENPDIYIYMSNDYYETSLKSYKAYIDEIFEKFKIYMKDTKKIDLKAEEVKVSNYTKKRYRVSLASFIDYLNYLNDLYSDINNFLNILKKIFFNPPIEVDIELSLSVYLYIANQFSKLYPDLLDKNIKDKHTQKSLYKYLFNFFAEHFKYFDKLFNHLNKPYKERKILEEQQIKEAKIDSEIQKMKQDIINLLNDEKEKDDDSLLIQNLNIILKNNSKWITNTDFVSYYDDYKLPKDYKFQVPSDMYSELFTFISELNDKSALKIILDILQKLSKNNSKDIKDICKIVYRLYIIADKNNNSMNELLKFYKILNIIYKTTNPNDEGQFFYPMYIESTKLDSSNNYIGIYNLLTAYFYFFNITIFIDDDNHIHDKIIKAFYKKGKELNGYKIQDLTVKQKDKKDKREKLGL